MMSAIKELVFLYSRRGRKVQSILPSDRRVTLLPGFGLKRLASYYQLFFKQRREKRVIIVDSCWWNLWLLVIHKMVFNSLLILRLRGNVHREKIEQKRYFSYFLNSWSLKKVDYVIVVSCYLKNELIGKKIDARKIFVLNTPMVLSSYGEVLLKKREQKNLRSRSPKLLLITNFHYRSKVDLIPAVINEIMKKLHLNKVFPEIKIVGDGRYRRLTEDGMLPKYRAGIRFVGHLSRDDVVQNLNETDLFLQISNLDAFPTVVQEAMLFGLPVIAYNSGGVNEQVRHGKNGYLFNSSTDAGEFVLQLITDEKKWCRFSENSRESALDWDPGLLREKCNAIFQQIEQNEFSRLTH